MTVTSKINFLPDNPDNRGGSCFSVFTKVFAIAEGLLPPDEKFARVFKIFTLEKGLIAGLLVIVVGLALLADALWVWRQSGYGELSYSDNLRRLIPATTLLILGIQIIFSSFFMSVLGLKTVTRKPPELATRPEKIKLA